MNFSRIGILCALPEEETYIVDAMENKNEEIYAGICYRSGKIGNKEIVVCCGGMGKANAASTAQVLISKYNAKAIIFSGIAGNMTEKIGIGDVVIGKTLRYHDASDSMLSQSPPWTSEYKSDTFLNSALEQGCRQNNVKYILGKIATGDRFIDDPAVKNKIKSYCNPDCVEMEGAAVAQTAMRNEIPFAVIRAMSDNSDKAVEESLGSGKQQEFLISEYSKTASSIVLAALSSL